VTIIVGEEQVQHVNAISPAPEKVCQNDVTVWVLILLFLAVAILFGLCNFGIL